MEEAGVAVKDTTAAAQRRLLRCAERVAALDAYSHQVSDTERENALADLHAAEVAMWALRNDSGRDKGLK